MKTLYVFSPCVCHSLNLCGAKSAVCCKDAMTFFGTIQSIYCIFDLVQKDGRFLFVISVYRFIANQNTRWTERVDSVRPFVTHFPGIHLSLNELLELNLTAKTKSEIYFVHSTMFHLTYVCLCQQNGSKYWSL